MRALGAPLFLLPVACGHDEAIGGDAAPDSDGSILPDGPPGQDRGVAVFDTRAAFSAACASALTTLDFEGIAPPGGATRYLTEEGYAAQGVSFVGHSACCPTCYELYVVSDSEPPLGARDWGTGSTLVSDRSHFCGEPGGHLVVTLPPGTHAVGTDFMTADSDGTKPSRSCGFVALLASGRVVVQRMSTPDGPAFMGIVADEPLVSLEYFSTDVGGTAPSAALDNFSFGPGCAVPGR
jgi:hypothetical protein